MSSVVVSQQGATLRVTDVVRNAGTAASARSAATYYLGDVRIGHRRVASLPPGGVSRGSTTIAIPMSFGVGAYRLRACADYCRVAAKTIRVDDRTAPTFMGLLAATTCLPGPVGGQAQSSAYVLRWSAAADTTTPASGIVYDIFQANASGAEFLTTPTYTTQAGVTSFSTPILPADRAYFFIVRARDEAGNRDSNTFERRGTNICR